MQFRKSMFGVSFVLDYACCFFEAVGTVGFFWGWKGAPGNPPICADGFLECFPVNCCAPGKATHRKNMLECSLWLNYIKTQAVPV